MHDTTFGRLGNHGGLLYIRILEIASLNDHAFVFFILCLEGIFIWLPDPEFGHIVPDGPEHIRKTKTPQPSMLIIFILGQVHRHALKLGDQVGFQAENLLTVLCHLIVIDFG